MNTPLTFGSLFAGIGGLDLGFERAGMTCKWQVEINDYATRVLEKHWPDVKRWRDVSEFIADTLRFERQPGPRGRGVREGNPLYVDVICGGFPCQPVSVAGDQRGDADERWMWPEFCRVIEVLKPRYVVIENVPGLLSADAGRLFGNILGNLAAMGFDAEWTCIPAGAFGLPHLRWRIFIIAYTKQMGWQTGSGGSRHKEGKRQRRSELASSCEATADTVCERLSERDRIRSRGQKADSAIETPEWRSIEPVFRRGNPRLPFRVHRLRCLGNAVVPQVAEWVGRRIVEHADLQGTRTR